MSIPNALRSGLRKRACPPGGMAKANVYTYFETREALLLALLRDEWQRWFARLKKQARSTTLSCAFFNEISPRNSRALWGPSPPTTCGGVRREPSPRRPQLLAENQNSTPTAPAPSPPDIGPQPFEPEADFLLDPTNDVVFKLLLSHCHESEVARISILTASLNSRCQSRAPSSASRRAIPHTSAQGPLGSIFWTYHDCERSAA